MQQRIPLILRCNTSKSLTAGIGAKIMKTVAIQGMYTAQTSGVKTTVDGTCEVGVAIDLFK